MTAAKVLSDARAAGVTVRLVDGKVMMRTDGVANTKAAAVVIALRPHKDEIKAFLEAEEARVDFEERAAVIEHDGGAPRPWAEAIARLNPVRPPGDVPLKRWLQFIDDCGRFLDDGWAARADALGWTPKQLFGCDAVKPYARLGRAGLLWAVEGRKLVELTADQARIEIPGGRTSGFYPKTMDTGGVLVWELATNALDSTKKVAPLADAFFNLPAAADSTGVACAQCGAGAFTDPPSDAPTVKVFTSGKGVEWLHPECAVYRQRYSDTTK